MDVPLRETAIQRVLVRENLWMGAERELGILLTIVCGGLIFNAQNLVSMAFGIPTYVTVMYLLRRMAKVDPYMSKIFLRSVSYQPYYPPRPTPFVNRRRFPFSPKRKDY